MSRALRKTGRTFARSLSRAAMALALFACASPESTVARAPDEPPIALTSFGADVVLPGTRAPLLGASFPSARRGSLTLGFISDGTELATAIVEVESDTRASVTFNEAHVHALGGDGSRFEGELRLRATFESGANLQERALPVAFDVRRALDLTLDAAASGEVALMSAVRLRGAGFLAPEEGGTSLHLQGAFSASTGPRRGQRVVIDTATLASLETRSVASLVVGPELFGLYPGRFEGTLRAKNTPLSGAASDESPAVALTLDLGASAIEALTPSVRRGQRLVARGRGFLPRDGRAGQATILRLEGSFTERRGGAVRDWTGEDAVELVGTYEGPSAVSYLLRPWQRPSGELAGLGVVAGTFEGRVTPLSVRGNETVVGTALTTQLVIGEQRQVVYLKYLPGFTDALRIFGLRNVEQAIRARILEVCQRDYARWAVEFREARPGDYEEYEVVEVGGADPNGQGLFGLDNTTGKDLGNLRFDDVIGGYNAETEEQGYLAFGGIFLESFLGLSPKAPSPLPIADPRFDTVFDPLRPDRGGVPVAALEYPGSRRDAVIAEAIRVLGNLVGTTVTHEIGHTLGMAIAEGYFHNPIPGPNQLMDSGDERPFDERAELGGAGPATFEPEHVEYLDQILPRD